MVSTIVVAAHFVLSSWLYFTLLYAVLAGLVATAVAVVVGVQDRWGDEAQRLGGFWITLVHGVILLVGGAVVLLL